MLFKNRRNINNYKLQEKNSDKYQQSAIVPMTWLLKNGLTFGFWPLIIFIFHNKICYSILCFSRLLLSFWT